MKALIIAPHLDSTDVGEVLVAFELVSEMSRHADLTILAFECRKGPPLAEQLPLAEVITFREPGWSRNSGRLNAMAKPFIFPFNRKVARWMRRNSAAKRFDVAHQILPAAPRYGSPFAGIDMPFIIGPVGGALPTPDTFRGEVGSAPWFTRLRALDDFRFRHDPWLRRTYRNAALVLGVAPYMREILAPLQIRRFEPFLGIGVDDLAPAVERHQECDRLALLHVGRAVRTKGLRDSVRALAELKDLPGVTLTSIGGGEEVEICRREAERLGVADRVRILGHLPRREIEALYRESDVFIFPSFRESMGAVLYEAMRWGLPAITVDCGGPGWIVDESCGLKVELTSPEIMPGHLAGAIRQLARDLELRRRLSEGARRKIVEEALWPVKAQQMLELYADVAMRARS
ncbi:MAG TPA: glycosyltransferase [Paracoccaceae bacterium]|nr:glycosyltransferase [Paracoccaceae bacterium]